MGPEGMRFRGGAGDSRAAPEDRLWRTVLGRAVPDGECPRPRAGRQPGRAGTCEEGRYQIEARALRLAMERAVYVLVEASRVSREDHTREDIAAAIGLMRTAAGIDFADPEQRRNYRPPGGC